MKKIIKSVGIFAFGLIFASALVFAGRADASTPAATDEYELSLVSEERVVPEYYGRAALSSLQNSEALLFAYDAISEGIEISLETITVYDGVHPITQSEIQMVVDAYRRDRTEHFWLGNGYSISTSPTTVHSVAPKYIFSGEALAKARAEFDAAVEEYLKLVDGVESEFERELILHDALAADITYVAEAQNAHDAYGAIVKGEAVCEGYAEALGYLLMRSGIQSFIITGESVNPSSGKPEGHAWNAVKIDGKFYHVDLTWNDQVSDIFHAYFNQPTSVIEEDHAIDSTVYPLPVCNYSDANYFNVKGGAVSSPSVSEVAKLLKSGDFSAHVYVGTDVNSFVDWYYANISAIAVEAGVVGSFSYGCSYLGREIVLSLVPTAYFSGVSLSVGSDYSFRYYAKLNDKTLLQNGNKLAVRFTYGKYASIVYDYEMKEDAFVFTYSGIAFHKMCDALTAELILVYPDSRYRILGQKGTYSVEQYCAELLEAYKDSEAITNLVNDMLILGKSAQEYLNYNTASLPTAGITPEASSAKPEASDVPKITGNENPYCMITEVSVNFNGAPMVYVEFYSKSADFTLLTDGVAVSDLGISSLGGGRYRYTFSTAVVLDFDLVHIIELKSAEETCALVHYGINSYAAALENSEPEMEEEKALSLALYRVGVSAEAYLLSTEKPA